MRKAALFREHTNRFLAALTVALLLGLVAITVVGGVALGAILRYQAESMSPLPGSDIIVRDDGTSDDGTHIRYTGNADQADRATQAIDPSQQVNQIQLRVRQSGSDLGDDRLAVYVDDGPQAIGTVLPPAGARWETHVLDLSSSPISAGPHTLQIGPAQANDAFVALDYFELDTGTTPPLPGGDTTITSGPLEGSTDTDGRVEFGFSGTDSAGSPVSSFECSLVLSGRADSFSACTNPKSYPALASDPALANGNYVFKVRGKDAAGNVDSSPAVRNFSVSVSTTPPPSTPSAFNPGWGKGDARECTTTISSGSIENAAAVLGNGQVLCVRGGVYTEGDKRLNLDVSGTSSAPKKIKAYPGERVELRGAIIGKGSHWIIEGLFVDASYSPVMTTPGKDGPRTNTDQAIKWSGGTNLRFDSVELINRRWDLNPDLAGSCLFFGGTKPTNIIIESSSIHQCGELPRTNHEHCLYLGNSSGVTVRNNWVYDCADRSIQLSPDTDFALVVGNLVDSDHQNGIDLNNSADNNTVRNNVVDTPNGKTIYTGGDYSGSGNAVIDNCVWDTNVILASNVTKSGNVLADPLISGHTVTNSSCAAKLPADSPFRP